jgi:hypothetical protein
LPAELIEQWDSDPAGSQYRMRLAQGVAVRILNAVSDDDQVAIVESFESLPAAAVTAIIGELSMGSVCARPLRQ